MQDNLTTSELYIKQLEYEQEAVDLGKDQFFSDILKAEEGGRGADTSHARSMVAQVAGGIVDSVKKHLDKSKNAYTAPLKELKYDRAVIIALRTLFVHVTGADAKRPVTRVSACIAIAEGIQLELKMQSLCESSPKYMSEVQSNWKSKKAASVRHKGNVVNHIMKDKNLEWRHWDKGVKTGVGGLLLACILGNSDIFRERTMKAGRNRSETLIEFTDDSEEWIAKHKDFRSLLRPLYRPMVVPPMEWNRYNRPYLSDALNSTLRFVRCRNKDSRKFYRDIHPSMYRAVSIAQATPWRINKKVHNLIKRLAALQHPLIIPASHRQEKPVCPVPPDVKPDDMTDEQAVAFKHWKSEVRTIYTEDVARRSNRNRLVMVTDIADEYRAYDKIYFPHSVDSRGRIYSIPTVLQPQGDDLCKGILEFAEGEKLTKDGLYQLKLHIASKYGLDKESHTDRLEWFSTNSDMMLQVAEHPLDNLAWLAEADKPFQVYAAICDYARWIKDPECIIHARVNKDGACNGLQHFSAMLKDGDVGKSVNLTPSTSSDTPMSIYKVVADETQSILEDRASSGDARAQIWLSFWKNYTEAGVVDYKCMKRPVMTLPYSATMYSRMQYIKDYTREKKAHKFFGDDYGKCIKYFADTVTLAMDKRISSARLILDWLISACRDIMKEHGSVEWQTPMGFDVYNRKNKQVGRRISIRYEGKPIWYRFREVTDKPDINGMASAIAPNFVHSMDACHMLRIVQRCADSNINMLHLVHDDYGCHANHGQLLADIAKEEFARLYSENNPLQEFYDKYSDCIQNKPPKFINTLDLSMICKSMYAFD